ncbi:methyltransferase domain-containing protein [bacterium]|nr:methyltransferase domain-containing protein [bacterium]
MGETAREKYNRAARLYDLYEMPVEALLFSKLRKGALASVSGRTLEVGVGTGKNLQYYPENTNLTAIDFSSSMLRKAKKRAKLLEMENVTMLEQDIQSLTFPENHYDYITASCVFCTVPDPILGLQNLLRVLKPGGKAIFIEHMKTDNPLINAFLYAMNIMSTRMLGTSMIRETDKNIRNAGFSVLSVKGYLFNVVKVIVATKDSE